MKTKKSISFIKSTFFVLLFFLCFPVVLPAAYADAEETEMLYPDDNGLRIMTSTEVSSMTGLVTLSEKDYKKVAFNTPDMSTEYDTKIIVLDITKSGVADFLCYIPKSVNYCVGVYNDEACTDKVAYVEGKSSITGDLLNDELKFYAQSGRYYAKVGFANKSEKTTGILFDCKMAVSIFPTDAIKITYEKRLVTVDSSTINDSANAMYYYDQKMSFNNFKTGKSSGNMTIEGTLYTHEFPDYGDYTLGFQISGTKAGNTYRTSNFVPIQIHIPLTDTKAPVIKGVKNKKTYDGTRRIYYSDDAEVKSATLNGTAFESGSAVSTPGDYELVVEDYRGHKKKVRFSIVDTKKPIVKGVKNKKTYFAPVTITFSDKYGIQEATLNGITIENGEKVRKKGAYELIVTDINQNIRKVKFWIE